MADFATCFPFVLANEDYDPPQYKAVADPTESDPTAEAIAGINSAFWPAQFAAILAVAQSERGPAVAAFYQENFWNSWLEQLVSNKIAAMVLDASVNQGAGWATKFLQTACSVEVDGKFGPNTLAAANALPSGVIVPAFIEARQARYRQVGGPSLDEWLQRAEKIPAFD
jgi:lysozyme family protein